MCLHTLFKVSSLVLKPRIRFKVHGILKKLPRHTLKLVSSEVFVLSKACTVVEYQNVIYFFKTDGKVLKWEYELFFIRI